MKKAGPPLKEPRDEPRIFLCHASEDKPRVRELYHKLKAAGYRPWLDKEDLLPGQDWRHEIEKIIRDPYNIVVVCLSCHSILKRGVVQQEIKWALDMLEQASEDAIYLIPARLEACQVPARLAKLQWVDVFEPDGFERLKRTLDLELGQRSRIAPSEEPSPGSKRVAFLTYHQRYVTAMDGEAEQIWDRWVLRAETKALGDRETFTLLCLDGGLVAFKTSHGRYVTALDDEGPRDWVLRAETKTLGDWEKFMPVNAETQEALSGWEVSGLLAQGNVKEVAFKTHHDRYVTAVDEGERGCKLRGPTKTLSDRGKFTIIPLP
jgi:hypothetical protein